MNLGEANIARFLHRLISQKSKEDLKESLLVDECIDECVDGLVGNKMAYVNKLKKKLKGQYLAGGDKASLADYFVWFQLREANVATTESPLNEWLKRLDNHSFIQVLNTA